MRDNAVGGALTETTFLILLAVWGRGTDTVFLQFIREQTGGRGAGGGHILRRAGVLEKKGGWLLPRKDRRKNTPSRPQAGRRSGENWPVCRRWKSWRGRF